MGLSPDVLSAQMLGGLGRSAWQLRRMDAIDAAAGVDGNRVHRLRCSHFGWAYSSCLPAGEY